MHLNLQISYSVSRLGLLASLLLGMACTPDHRPVEPPLRPLLYTEAPARDDDAADEAPAPFEDRVEAEPVDPVAWPTRFSSVPAEPALGDLTLVQATTPDRLMLDVFYALVATDAGRLFEHAFSAEELVRSARMGAEAAEEAAAELATELRELHQLFATGSASQRREGGWSELLEPGQIVVGRPRDINGQALDEAERNAAVMHWGSEMVVHVRDTNIDFVLRFPNVIRGTDGLWRLRRPPRMDDRFSTWRSAGFDLKEAMMRNEHAAYPVDVGNYWHYRTRRPAATDGASAIGALTNLGYRDEVTSVEDHVGYRVARLRRTYDDPTITSERHALLLTALRVYDCNRECVRRRADASWILDYAHRTTPELVFPLTLGSGWGSGGRDRTSNVHRVQTEFEVADVPSGRYDDAYAIVTSTSQGTRSRYVVPGVGVVLTRTARATHTDLEELTEVRILQ